MTAGGLARRGFAAVLQSYVANLVRAMLQFGVGVLLARMLGPEEFGLVAIGWIVVSIGALVMDIGLSSSIIQTQDFKSEEVAYIFYLQVAIGVALAALVAICAPTLANALSAEDATPLIRVMALTFVMKAVGQTSFALLNREMRFGALQIITVASYGFGFGAVALTLAALGYGSWSIAAAAVIQASVAAVAYICLARPPLKIDGLRPPKALLSFGAKTMGANLLSWIIYNVDAMIVSRFLGPAALGLYSRALALANVPTIIISSIQPLLFSGASRIQSQRDLIGNAFLAVTTAVAMIMAPILIVASVLSADVIVGLYGEPWRPAAAALTPLALAIIVNAFSLLPGPLLMSINQTHREVWAQGTAVVVMLAVLPFAAMHSLQAASWALLGVYSVRMVFLTRAILNALEIRTSEFIRATVPALLVMPILPLIAALGVRHLTGDWSGEARLGMIVIGSAVGYAAALVIAGPILAAGPLSNLLARTGHVPGFARRWMKLNA